jgi:hypothetical protein
MEKTYSVTYKTYYNDRLNKVSFHGKQTYPLYIQVTYNRKSHFFKSYYFNLFSKAKYGINVAGKIYAPDLKDIIKKEETLIEFVIDKNPESFSLDLFKKEYAFYSRDLLDIMEDTFLDYLHTFLHDEGLPNMAETVRPGVLTSKAYELVRDMRKAFNPTLYKKLVESSLYYAPPYLLLYEFSEKPQQTALRIFTVMEWEQVGIKNKFEFFFKKNYPDNDLAEILREIQKWVAYKAS